MISFARMKPMYSRTTVFFTLTGSTVLLLMGLLAEMLVRTYHDSQEKSIYAVREKIGFRE